LPSEEHLLAFLADLSEAGLLFREGERYLSLAVEARPREIAAARKEAVTGRRRVTLNAITTAIEA
jgi:hypothetical protein